MNGVFLDKTDPMPIEVRYRSHEYVDELMLATEEAAGRLDMEIPRWNTMKDMRKALGLPLGTDGITEFLLFWDSLNQAQRTQFRRDDLNNIDDWDFPKPSIIQGESDV